MRKILYPAFLIVSTILVISCLWLLVPVCLIKMQPRGAQIYLSTIIDNSSVGAVDSSLRSKVSHLTFLAVGDISLSRNVAAKIDKYHDPLKPFAALTNVLQQADWSMANLESPFSGKNFYPKTGSLVFNAPLPNVAGLVQYNFKALNLANNHALDQGLPGLAYTIKYLRDQGLSPYGAGQDLDQAWQPIIINQNNIKVGIVGASYSSLNDNGKDKNNYVARLEDETRLKQTVQDLKNKVDLVVVTMHAGIEYTRTPNKAQVQFAHTAIDAGADIVIGHHPHWIQTIEQYQGKYIFYSLGNFIFDQMWSQDTREGLMLKVSLEKTDQTNITELRVIPMIIEDYFQPRSVTPQESQTILKKTGRETDLIYSQLSE